MKKLSFKEYLDSKQKLLLALKETPVQTITYSVKKYCTLIVGEKDDKQYVSLKPSQQLVVEWRYNNVYAPPIPVNIQLKESKAAEQSNYCTFWAGTRLQKWLRKNAEEE